MRNWTLRAKLVSGVGIVIVLAMAALGLLFVSLLSNLDKELLGAIGDRTAANAKQLAGDIAFYVGTKDQAETEKTLAGFMAEHGEAHAIAVLDAERKPFVGAGAQVDATAHLAKGGEITKVESEVKGDLVVAAAPCADEGNVFGFVVYFESLAEYRAARARLLWLGLGEAMLSG